MEGQKRKESIQTSEEILTLQKENEELKEVLSAVQIDLEAKTEVLLLYYCHPPMAGADFQA